jgi:superfamily II DNA or RNA helicase
MKFVRKSPDAGYWGRELWLPRAHVNEAAIRNGLTFDLEDETQIIAYKDERDHIVVPRETFSADKLERFGFPIYDVRSRDYEDIWFHDRFVPRDPIQEEAWEALSVADGGVLNLACGRGKSGLALKKGAQLGGPILIIITNTGTVEGWLEEIEKFLGIPPHQVGVIRQSQFEWDRPVAIATIQTLSKKVGTWPGWFLRRWKLVILDEVHHASARTFSRALPLFSGERLGLTATVEREDGLESLYMFHIGKVLFSDLTQDLPAKIHFVQTSFTCDMADPAVLDKAGQFNIGKFRSWLGAHAERNELIAKHVGKAQRAGRKVLGLSHSVGHVEALAKLVEGSGVIHGQIAYDKRLQILRDHRVVFATPGCAEEAMNDPALDTMMFLTPYKVWRTFQQGVGRIQRPYEGKKKPLVTLFEDVRMGPCKGLCNKLKGKLRRKGYGYTTVPARHRSRLERMHTVRTERG